MKCAGTDHEFLSVAALCTKGQPGRAPQAQNKVGAPQARNKVARGERSVAPGLCKKRGSSEGATEAYVCLALSVLNDDSCDPGASCSLRSHLPLATLFRACGAPTLSFFQSLLALAPGYLIPRLRRSNTKFFFNLLRPWKH